jgi:hypothetical protein
MEWAERHLASGEKRLLRARIATARRAMRTAIWRVSVAGIAVCGGLCAATLAASTAPPLSVIATWLAVGFVVVTWSTRGERSRYSAAIGAAEAALAADSARELRVQAQQVVEVEESEDEGACWLFEVRTQVLVLAGQEYYETARFPSDDFSVVEVRGRNGQHVDVLLDVRGKKATATKRIPASARPLLPAGGSPQEITGTLEQLLPRLARRESDGAA